jgi:hypothetical protein
MFRKLTYFNLTKHFHRISVLKAEEVGVSRPVDLHISCVYRQEVRHHCVSFIYARRLLLAAPLFTATTRDLLSFCKQEISLPLSLMLLS